MAEKVLVVDLDGTLIHTDMLHESAVRLLRDRPLAVLGIPALLARGKAALKRHLAAYTRFNPATLPYNETLLAWLRDQRAEGRRLVLCTASDQSIAEAIARHLGIFDEVIASDGARNVSGEQKANVLVERFGRSGFDYAGNSRQDLPVWACAHRAIVVNAPRALVSQVEEAYTVVKAFPSPRRGVRVWANVLRVHQWLKNLLLFVPLLAAHEFDNAEAWISLLLAFFAFSICASSVYVANDLLDLESDRRHPRKKRRPFAAGQVPVWAGALLAPLLLAFSLGLAIRVNAPFFAWLVVYFALTCAYSLTLKRLMLVDCLTLALLHTLRIVAGGAASDNTPSFWLLAFSIFLFLSLAFVKRYTEMDVQQHNGQAKIHGRGYHTADAPLIRAMGIVSGYLSALVLALYLNSEAVVKLYRAPGLIWGCVPVMLFWISWIWMRAHRGEMHDDPVVFAVKDRVSLAAGVLFGAILLAGIIGLP